MDTTGLTPREFFSRKVEGALMSDACRATGIAYSTIHAIANGAGAQATTLGKLAQWSRSNLAARAAGIHLSIDAIFASSDEGEDGGDAPSSPVLDPAYAQREGEG